MTGAFLHSGDLGDVMAALPLVRHVGGGEVVLSPHFGPGGPREPMTEARAAFILPVIASQPYVSAARFSSKPERITHDFSPFRVTNRPQRWELLTHWQARHFRITPAVIDLSPWIQVVPSPESRGMIVLARSPRYHNPAFKWQRVLRKHGDRAIFVGLPDDYAMFTKLHGTQVAYRPVQDALEMAQLIAGSDLFIGNQSFPCWLAMAMGHPLIQESFPPAINSQLKRPNARFVMNEFRI